MKLDKKQAFFVLVSVLLVSAFLEITLALAAFVSPRVDRLLAAPWISWHSVPDERLGYRPDPAYPGHDGKGFRNPEVPAQAHIVALGDSQTYGVGVEAEDAWPRKLESMTGKTVYSMAFPGYGPIQSLILWDEAVALQPNVVIEAFYAGNDLYDSFQLVYNLEQFPELRTSDPELEARVREAEQSEPIQNRISRMIQLQTTVTMGTTVTRDGFSPRRLLSQHSKIYGLLRRTKHESLRWVNKLNNAPEKEWETAKAFADAHQACCQEFSDGQFRTIFTSERRLSALNLADPRVVEGLQISVRALQRMHELAAARNIRFLVVLLPTKETVFRRLWQHPSTSYRSLTENEARVWTVIKDHLAHSGIEYLDALPVLREQLATGIQPYPVSHDGHPNEHGHKAIARLVAARLGSPKTSQTLVD